MSLFERLATVARQKPDDIALIDPVSNVSWQQMLVRVDDLAERLKAYQYQVVALYADNSVDWVLTDLACMKAEVILLPLPTFFSQQQIVHSIESSGAVAVITDNVASFDKSFQDVVAFTKRLQLFELPVTDAQADIPERTSKITFTSGSTGQPKGVCLSVDNQLAVAQSLVERTALTAPKHLCVLPLSTLLENIAGVYAPLLSGGQVCLLAAEQMGFNGGKGFNALQFVQAISQQQPNSLIVLPELLQALLTAVAAGWEVPESIEFIAVGGSRVSPQLLSRANELGLPVYEGYGLSECSSVVCLNGVDDNRPGTVGKVLPHLKVQLVDGQVVVSGNAFLGYLNQPETWGVDQVYTGDLAEFDGEGYLHISGRIKNLLISSFGRNISPEWVESEVMAHPMIHHCVVVGDAKPYCSALIQKRDPAFSDNEIQQWLDQLNQRLPDYAQISQWQNFAEPLTVQAGTLTANGRPVRNIINSKFQSQIDDLYKEAS